jgi:hypothetical protein
MDNSCRLQCRYHSKARCRDDMCVCTLARNTSYQEQGTRPLPSAEKTFCLIGVTWSVVSSNAVECIQQSRYDSHQKQRAHNQHIPGIAQYDHRYCALRCSAIVGGLTNEVQHVSFKFLPSVLCIVSGSTPSSRAIRKSGAQVRTLTRGSDHERVAPCAASSARCEAEHTVA